MKELININLNYNVWVSFTYEIKNLSTEYILLLLSHPEESLDTSKYKCLSELKYEGLCFSDIVLSTFKRILM